MDSQGEMLGVKNWRTVTMTQPELNSNRARPTDTIRPDWHDSRILNNQRNPLGMPNTSRRIRTLATITLRILTPHIIFINLPRLFTGTLLLVRIDCVFLPRKTSLLLGKKITWLKLIYIILAVICF